MSAHAITIRPLTRYRPRKRAQRCFELGCLYFFQDPPKDADRWSLVHGEVRGPENSRVIHAWLHRDDGIVYDMVLDCSWSAEEYMRLVGGVEHVRYTMTEAAQMYCKYKHVGPWP